MDVRKEIIQAICSFLHGVFVRQVFAAAWGLNKRLFLHSVARDCLENGVSHFVRTTERNSPPQRGTKLMRNFSTFVVCTREAVCLVKADIKQLSY